MSDLKLDEFQPTPDAGQPSDGVERSAADLAAVYDVPVNIQAVLGRANMEVASLLRLSWPSSRSKLARGISWQSPRSSHASISHSPTRTWARASPRSGTWRMSPAARST